MSSEYDKVPPAHIERELPLTVGSLAINDLHSEILKQCSIFRKKYPDSYVNFHPEKVDNIDEVIQIIDSNVERSTQPAFCAIRAISTHMELDYKSVIHDALRAWKRFAIPFILDVDLTRGVALQGYRAIILCTHLWDCSSYMTAGDKQGHLSASSATTAIIGALMIINWVWKTGSKNSILSTLRENESRTTGTEIFIRFTCDQVLPSIRDLKCLPGRDLGLRPGTSIRFTRELEIQIATKGIGGEVVWGPVPYLHPTYKTIGSQWGKFFRNRSQGLFFKGNYTEPKFKKRPLVFAIPYRTFEELENIRQEYSDEKTEMTDELDQAGFSNCVREYLYFNEGHASVP
uniref:Mating-type protein MAT1-1-2 n=1 Tax=Thielaviopsis punctulata TaxID=72032 RepID=A0A2R4ZPY5_9PEZI|nr:TPA_exp: mating-type protein MAT1-1-2 [Thielaviopsis punctulata]